MKFIDTKSLKFKLWLYFTAFAVAILIVLWMLQILFIGSYYKGMRTGEILRAAAKIEAAYGTPGFDIALGEASFRNGLSVQLTDAAGRILASSDPFGNPQLIGGIVRQGDLFITYAKEVVGSDTGSFMTTSTDPRFRGNRMVYGKIISGNITGEGDKVILFLTASLDPLDPTVNVLKNQLIYISAILIGLAFLTSIVISRRLTKPIAKMNKSAGRLAKGDYGVEFEKGEYSEINQLADTLNFATGELLKTDTLRRDLISNVSHDLRTPLTLIKAFAERIRDFSGRDPKKRDEHLQVIINESDRLSGLVTDILDLSKVQAGIEDLKLENFDLAESTSDIMKRFSIMTDREGYVFESDIKSDGPLMVSADKGKIGQVIYNLVSNAVNYTGDDKHIRISLHDTGDLARFEVADTGKGISEENMTNIWDRYYKVKGETHKQAMVGTGLGLSIVKSILMAHDARFGVKSEPGKGSIFWFELKK